MCERAPAAHVLGAVIRMLICDFRRVNRLVLRREDSANFQLGAVGLMLPPGCLFRTKSIWSIDFAADNADNAPGHSSSGAAHMSCAHTEQAHGSTHAASFTLTISLCCSGTRPCVSAQHPAVMVEIVSAPSCITLRYCIVNFLLMCNVYDEIFRNWIAVLLPRSSTLSTGAHAKNSSTRSCAPCLFQSPVGRAPPFTPAAGARLCCALRDPCPPSSMTCLSFAYAYRNVGEGWRHGGCIWCCCSRCR